MDEMEVDTINKSLKRKCNIEIDEEIVYKKFKLVKIDNNINNINNINKEPICHLCNNKYTQLPIIKLNCEHYYHVYCMLNKELENYSYFKPFMCNICNKKHSQILIIRTKTDVLELIETYFQIFRSILNQSQLNGRPFYEYKRNLFYIITKKIGIKLNCNIGFLDNISSKFIIKANHITKEDILVTKFDYIQ